MVKRPDRARLRARYDRRQQDVFAAAARLFAEQGFHGTSMNDLAEESGITVGGLYHYFGNKDELLYLIVRGLIEPLTAELEAIAAGPGSAEERFRAAVRSWVGHVERHPDQMRVFIQERNAGDPVDRQNMRSLRKAFEEVIDGLLRAVEAEHGRAFPDRGLVLHALLGMVNWTAQWLDPGGRLGSGSIADGYCALVLGSGDRAQVAPGA